MRSIFNILFEKFQTYISKPGYKGGLSLVGMCTWQPADHLYFKYSDITDLTGTYCHNQVPDWRGRKDNANLSFSIGSEQAGMIIIFLLFTVAI